MRFTHTDKPFPVFSVEADRDYLLARLVNFTGSGFAPRAGYLGQQALEKYLKALTVQKEGIYVKTHDLIILSEYCAKYDPIFSNREFVSKIKVFDDFREVGRYGGEANYDPHAVQDVDFMSAGVYSWADTNINFLDEAVFSIRGKLDFKESGFSDSLHAIIKNEKKDILVATWKLHIPLREILIAGNDYYK